MFSLEHSCFTLDLSSLVLISIEPALCIFEGSFVFIWCKNIPKRNLKVHRMISYSVVVIESGTKSCKNYLFDTLVAKVCRLF